MPIRIRPSSIKAPSPRLNKFYSNTTANMQNNQGQGVSHATGDSKVPNKVQQKAPEGLEKNLPDSIHPTGGAKSGEKNVSHAKGNGADSIVPQKLQEVLPESVERAVPNAIHNTGDTDGAHRKQ